MVESTFGEQFDSVIRHGNHNETNGIPIGPEVSRIFSEILFQEIDCQVISKLTDLKFDVDYSFRRYVDDVYIFTNNETVAQRIYDVYADTLVAFNLHANSSKSITINRPFLTEKSRLIFDATSKANSFFESFLEKNGNVNIQPKSIHSPWKLTKLFIDSLKALCSQSSANYDEIASFIIAMVTERVKKIVNNNLSEEDHSRKEDYLKALHILLDILYFMYSVAPSVGASYKLSTAIILTVRFTREHIPQSIDTICQQIYDLTIALFSDQFGKNDGENVAGFVRLEYLNVLLAIRELGNHYLIPEKVISTLFVDKRKLSYFTAMSCLFYIRNDLQYENIRKEIDAYIDYELSDLTDILESAEKAYLFLDAFSCPFISEEKKIIWIQKFQTVIQKPAIAKKDAKIFVQNYARQFWQVNWADVDLLNSLEKKELKQAY